LKYSLEPGETTAVIIKDAHKKVEEEEEGAGSFHRFLRLNPLLRIQRRGNSSIPMILA